MNKRQLTADKQIAGVFQDNQKSLLGI